MKKIVVIEDDLILRENITTFLQEEGFDVKNAPDGLKGVTIVNEELPDLILCDISMPNMNGYEVFTTLHGAKLTSQIPFIFLTAKTQRSEMRKGMELGVDDYLTKPFDFDDLMRSVNARLKKQEQTQKINEENYKTITEQSLTGIFIIQNDVIVYVNPKFTEITGYSFAEVIGKSIIDIIKPFDADLLNETLGLVTDGSSFQNDCKIINRNSQPICVACAGGPIIYNNKPAIIGNLMDISAQKEAQQTILNTIFSAEQAERKRFASDLHDGLAPLLSGAKLFTQKLANKLKDSVELAGTVKQMDELINLSIESCREIALNLTPAILSDFGLHAAINNFIIKIEETDSVIINYTNSDTSFKYPEIVSVTLYRVITELINNTLKHAHAKVITIELKPDNVLIIFNYGDDGVGIYREIAQSDGSGFKNIADRLTLINGKFKLTSIENYGMRIYSEIGLMK